MLTKMESIGLNQIGFILFVSSAFNKDNATYSTSSYDHFMYHNGWLLKII